MSLVPHFFQVLPLPRPKNLLYSLKTKGGHLGENIFFLTICLYFSKWLHSSSSFQNRHIMGSKHLFTACKEGAQALRLLNPNNTHVFGISTTNVVNWKMFWRDWRQFKKNMFSSNGCLLFVEKFVGWGRCKIWKKVGYQ